MAGVVDGLTFDARRMRERAGRGFTHAMDLAETIMQEAGVPYRSAHRVVGLAVRKALERDASAQSIPAGVLDEAATEVLGRPLALSPRSLAVACDPVAVVATRTCLGGAAEAPLRTMIRDCEQKLAAAETWRRRTAERIAGAERRLVEYARARRPAVKRPTVARRVH
jgi:argininosuccinate lyase